MPKVRFNEPRVTTAKQRMGDPTEHDRTVVAVDLKSALTSAPRAKTNSAVLLQASEDERGVFVDVRLYLTEPAVSPSGKSFACGWGTTEAGEMKVNAMAYIPIPKEDRYRYAHLAAAAAAAKAAKASKAGRVADDDE